MRKVQASQMTQGWEAEVLNCPEYSRWWRFSFCVLGDNDDVEYHYHDIEDNFYYHYHVIGKRSTNRAQCIWSCFWSHLKWANSRGSRVWRRWQILMWWIFTSLRLHSIQLYHLLHVKKVSILIFVGIGIHHVMAHWQCTWVDCGEAIACESWCCL